MWLYNLETVGPYPYQKRLQLFEKGIFYSVKTKTFLILFHDFVLLMLTFSYIYDKQQIRQDLQFDLCSSVDWVYK